MPQPAFRAAHLGPLSTASGAGLTAVLGPGVLLPAALLVAAAPQEGDAGDGTRAPG